MCQVVGSRNIRIFSEKVFLREFLITYRCVLILRWLPLIHFVTE